EWAETGVAEGAWPVSMHRPEFGQELSALFERFGHDRIAMICATGGRTAYVQSILRQNGIAGLTDVSEGMLGNGQNPGWIARGLPVVTVQEAMAAYQAALAAK
ncbi:MAG: rhodanese-like domain-containing protein, partial [Pseudomonadota bacterium]